MEFVLRVNDYHTQVGFGKRKLLDIDGLQSNIKDTPSNTSVQQTTNLEAHVQLLAELEELQAITLPELDWLIVPKSKHC